MRLRPRAFTIVFLLGCAHPGEVETVRHVDYAAPAVVPVLAGARCQDGHCRCRAKRGGDDKETAPPAAGQKRFEIRMKVAGGVVEVDSPTLGKLRHDGDEEQCFYVDLPAGSNHQFIIDSHEAKKGEGLTPSVSISEYGGPKGYWYGVVNVSCGLGDRRCDRPAAEVWKEEWLSTRKRGRLDACGSTVVSALKWDTSGGLHARDGGLLRDFRVQFLLQVKAFDPQLPPNSPQCVPE